MINGIRRPVVLVIRDGWGENHDASLDQYNAIKLANLPFSREIAKKWPRTEITTHGLQVGLPEGIMGNSEVGHQNIGAGRIVDQEIVRIDKGFQTGSVLESPVLGKVFEKLDKDAMLRHLSSLLQICADKKYDKVFLHAFTDGRDTAPTSGLGFIREVEEQMKKIGVGKVASVIGRFWAMDRDKRWDRVQKAYDCLVGVKAEAEVTNPEDAFTNYYEKPAADNMLGDEFIVPTWVVENGAPIGRVKDGDAVIFFNFRPDRAREMTRAFTQSGFDGFDVTGKTRKVYWTCMTQYDEKFVGVDIAYRPETYSDTLGEYLAKMGKTQLRIAETEKYAHVTFFFNGGVEAPNENETRILIPSPKVATYDLQPEMSANEVCERAIAEIEKGKYDVMILNYANCDMVGHTGVIPATVKAVATVDDCVRRVVECILQNGGRAFVTADHGNAEKMLAEDGSPFTAHTTNKVPFIMVDEELRSKTLHSGALCDIAPTMLTVMGLDVPEAMTGKSLVKLHGKN